MAIIRQMSNAGIILTQADGFTPLASSLSANTSEVTIFSDVIPANALTGINVLAFSFICDLTSGLVAPTLTVRIRLGTGVLVAASALAIAISQTTKPLTVSGNIMAQNSNSSQYAYAEVRPSSAINLGAASPNASAIWSLDTTQPLAFSISVQFGSVQTGTTLTPQRVTLRLN